MTSRVSTLRSLGDSLAGVAGAAMGSDAQRLATDDDLLATLAEAARIRRAADALLLDATAHILDRSDPSTPAPNRLTTRHGCRNVLELLQRTSRLARRTLTDVVTAAHAVRQHIGVSSGELLPAEFPAMRGALADAEVGLDAVVAVAGPLRASRVGRAAVAAADAELAAAARGEGADAAPPATVEELRQMACVWAAYFDQDGAEPREARALRMRGLTLGAARDGLVPVRGNLMEEVAAQLRLDFDSILNPKVDGVTVSGVRFSPPASATASTALPGEAGAPIDDRADSRSRAQKQHDALAIILSKATAGLPTLGGAAPTLVVTVREADLLADRGYAHIPGADLPVSLSVARHVACTGVIQRVVMNDTGRIVSISTTDRVFSHHQRKAIIARDGGCIIPGCHVPSSWCEIHHVDEHSRGGPTHTDNGVLLCFFHHRTLDTSGWRVRMNHGIPEVRGPSWWDPDVRWRPVTASPPRLLERIEHRT